MNGNTANKLARRGLKIPLALKTGVLVVSQIDYVHNLRKINLSSVFLVLNVSFCVSGYIQTPSPSDSGVCDIEAMLRDKDAEIQTLRETMANNEAVIFQVKYSS